MTENQNIKTNRRVARTSIPPNRASAQARFGMFGGVFVPCVLTILGVIMFMRTGFVIGQSGVWLGFIILGISKLITTLTTLSLSAITSNLKMEGGGVYFMISRVLGPDFGGSIGITLYFAQAVGVAFYVIGFTEALFSVLAPLLSMVNLWNMDGNQLAAQFFLPQIISSAVVAGLFALTFKGAEVAIKAQYGVLAVLLISVLSFLIGGTLNFDSANFEACKKPAFEGGVNFWMAFAIFFPAATGITAGANMSGDLKNPAKAIPWGTLLAIVFTLAIYALQIVLVSGASDRSDLKANPFEALQEMSVFGPLIVLGVFAATLSSALGSFLGAPRILQAMGQDRLMKIMIFFGKGSGPTNEPKRATVITFVFAVGVIWAGDLNAVAEVISMFFLIAYGMINLSAFVESKSGNPSFRPTFRWFHWSTGLTGAVLCGVAMMKINDTYALIALVITFIIYFYLRKRDIKTSYGDAKRGFIFQRTRDNLFYLEGAKAHPKNWRPMLVAISEDPLKHSQLVRMGAWLESQRGLYSVVQIVERRQDDLETKVQYRRQRLREIQRQLAAEETIAFSDVLVTNDYYDGLSNFLQSYSLGGLRPNTALISMPTAETDTALNHLLKSLDILATFDLNLVVLKPGDIAPQKKRRTIDLWWRGKQNGSLMALFAYLMTLDRTWSGAKVRLLRAVQNESEERKARRHLEELRKNARIEASIELIRSTDAPTDIIAVTSGPTADLVMLGMSARTADEVRHSIDSINPLLERLPAAILVWSNGEADVFV